MFLVSLFPEMEKGPGWDWLLSRCLILVFSAFVEFVAVDSLA